MSPSPSIIWHAREPRLTSIDDGRGVTNKPPGLAPTLCQASLVAGAGSKGNENGHHAVGRSVDWSSSGSRPSKQLPLWRCEDGFVRFPVMVVLGDVLREVGLIGASSPLNLVILPSFYPTP